MHLTLTRSELESALGRTRGVISPRTTLPVLSCVLLQAAGDQLTVVATDLDMTLRVTHRAVIQREGALAVPAGKLQQIARGLSNPEVELNVDKKQTITVSGGSSRFGLKGTDSGEFPSSRPLTETTSCTLDQAALAEALRLVAFAAGKDPSRHILLGVHFHFKGGILHLVSTDGRRLAFIELPVSLATEHQFTVPSAAITNLLGLLESGEVHLEFTEAAVLFRGGNWEFQAKLIDGNYPVWRQVVPRTEGLTFTTILVEDLADATSRVQHMTTEKANSVGLLLENGQITLSTASELGEAREVLTSPTATQGLRIRFNPLYLLEALRRLGVDSVEFAAADSKSPGLLRARERRWSYVIMPVVGGEAEAANPAPAQS